MSFNIRGAYFEDGVNHWQHRSSLNVRTILNYLPDLIGFQELHDRNLETYLEHLKGYAFDLGPAYNNSPPFQYPAIAWNPSRIRKVESDGFWLSLTPEERSASWETNCIRSANWSRFSWLETGISFIHLNTHLDHISEEARVEGTKLILNRLKESDDKGIPQIITGDFNCLPGSQAYQLFIGSGFRDAYLQAGYSNPVMTYHGFLGSAVTESLTGFDRIDWVLLRRWPEFFRVHDWRRAEDADPPVYPSDHYPVIVDCHYQGM
jgi:endonuclease/exonuclease/phosphatase family metal-dependent hydrolase